MAVADIKTVMKSGARARLIPVLADTSKENRATSVFLACLGVVDEFAKAMLASIGQRVGKRTKVDCYTEVVFQDLENKRDRPDGLIVLTTGSRQWSALVESKIGKAALDAEQVLRYLALAKANGIDGVITLSNQFVALPTHHPIKIPKNKLRGVELYHWSWMFMLTQAILLLRVEETLEVDQAYILEEMARYFRHESSGIRPFDQMNPEWKEVVLHVKSGGTLARGSLEVETTVGGWHQEQRDLCLILTRRLATPVSARLSRLHRSNPGQRLKDDSERLATEKKLTVTFDIPDAAAPLDVAVDIARRTIACSMSLSAPKDRKTTKARVNWLLRQLRQADPSNVFIESHWPGRAMATQTSLQEASEDPMSLAHENGHLVPGRFKVSIVKDIAGRFSGSRTFIEELERAVPDFYERIGEHLQKWVPPPPKIEGPKLRDADDADTDENLSEAQDAIPQA